MYLKEKVLDELRYPKKKKKCIKIKDASIHKDRIFQNDKIFDFRQKDVRNFENAAICKNRIFKEDKGMLYRKTQGTKQKRAEVPKTENHKEFWANI